MALKMRKNQSPPPPPCCPLLDCLAIIGGAWAPNVIWHLRGGPRRFSELRADIPQISPKVLTTRLRELETAGVIDRHVVPTSPPSVEYALNAFGWKLVPAIEAIAAVGLELQQHRQARGKPPSPRRRHPKHLHAKTPAMATAAELPALHRRSARAAGRPARIAIRQPDSGEP
ncbi:MAG: helix-turn-helix domain-containing protein [Alphaproteobacteria bacterium]